MKNFFKNLQFIFRPEFWKMIIPYDKQWDEDLNYLIDNCPCKLDDVNVISGEHYTIIFMPDNVNRIEVWIKNYPYSYGRPFIAMRIRNYRPSKLTILKLRKLEEKLHNIKYNDTFSTIC